MVEFTDLKSIAFIMESGCPWAEYRCLADICDEDPQVVRAARQRMVDHPLIVSLTEELAGWPGNVLNSHKSAGQLYHKLSFAADIGITAYDRGMEQVIEKVMANQSNEGPFQLPTNVPVHFGGSGLDTWTWALCDAPLLLYVLAKMGLADDPRILKGVDCLVGLVRDNGWPCAVSKELGKFRGPGRKDDPCPYATLIMLKLIALYGDMINGMEATAGAECLLDLWEKSTDRHPYMFYMGTDFRKLKAPFIWYDILHVADVLSQFSFVHQDRRFRDMLSVINSKADEAGLFTPGSEWKAWKGWDFAQKKAPSPWLTFLVYRINRRIMKPV